MRSGPHSTETSRQKQIPRRTAPRDDRQKGETGAAQKPPPMRGAGGGKPRPYEGNPGNDKQRPYQRGKRGRLTGEMRKEEHLGAEEGEADEEAEGCLILAIASIELHRKFGR